MGTITTQSFFLLNEDNSGIKLPIIFLMFNLILPGSDRDVFALSSQVHLSLKIAKKIELGEITKILTRNRKIGKFFLF